ncbi:Response regulator receiver domain-containing protein [Devosia enhydra]|uniref:Response regulator receiver domain-containing protein n=1 Tax=Devosia enhydra TaxID=665118 RepID=A0A1K2I2D4_9HYPH|nr:response regulator [Devosia enhydra]SFZ85916.1 Response regulator receiver domain-containing protein [Devosia enhydra]
MGSTILVVDDDAFVRMDLAEIVEESGFAACEACSVAEALALIDAAPERFAAVVTDIQMPGSRNGIVLANHVAYMWPHIRVIVISGGRVPLEGQLPFATPFIAKPYTAPTISAAILGAVADLSARRMPEGTQVS